MIRVFAAGALLGIGGVLVYIGGMLLYEEIAGRRLYP